MLARGSRIVAVAVPKVPEIEINYGTGGEVASESVADSKEPLRLTFEGDSYLDPGIRQSRD